MIRTVIGIMVLLAAVLWLPLWLQLVLFAAAIIIGPYRFFFIIPAIVSDALYAPTSRLSISNHWVTIIVFGMLALHWGIMKVLRVPTVYGVEA